VGKVKINWRVVWIIPAAMLALAFVVLLPSLYTYIEYEKNDCVPRLRANIGKEVELPEQTSHVLGKDIVTEPRRVMLKEVRYHFNDKPGFFEALVSLEPEREGGSPYRAGLSPAEVRNVIVLDEE